MPIAKWADVNRFPRKGMIRLGYQKDTGRLDRNGKPVTVPVKTDYFVCPPEVQAVYGERPKTLDIVIPMEGDVDDVFPQWYKLYGFSGLKGRSDGITKWERTEDSQSQADWVASRTNEKELEQLGYKEMATLTFLLPKVGLSGCYQIITGSFQSVVNINAMIKMIRAWVGRISGIPLHLTLEPQVVYYNDDGQQKKTTIYAMKLEFDPKEVQGYIKGRANAYSMDAPGVAGIPDSTERPLDHALPASTALDEVAEQPLDGGDAEEADGEFGPAPTERTAWETRPQQSAGSMTFEEFDAAISTPEEKAEQAAVAPQKDERPKYTPDTCPDIETHAAIPDDEVCILCKYSPHYANARRKSFLGSPTFGKLAGELKAQIETAKTNDILDAIYQRVSQNPTRKEFTRFEEAMLKGLINKRGEQLLQ